MILMKRYIINIILLALYVSIGIPIITSFLMPLVIDFINSSPQFLSPQWCSTVYRYANNTLETYQECSNLDLKPLVIFIVQVVVYVIAPLSLVFSIVRRR